MAVKNNSRIVGVKSSTLAMYEGAFAGVFGLGIALLWSLRSTFEYGKQTDSLLAGLAFGLSVGVVSIIVLPLLYFSFGWVLGYIQGFVFNVISETSGGIVLRIEQTARDKEK